MLLCYTTCISLSIHSLTIVFLYGIYVSINENVCDDVTVIIIDNNIHKLVSL